jgi:hypothetical protein
MRLTFRAINHYEAGSLSALCMARNTPSYLSSQRQQSKI